MQKQTTQALLNYARLLLEEGSSEAALTVLEAIHADTVKQQHDVSYLLGWYYILSKQWREAAHMLSSVFPNERDEDEENTEQETLLERERSAIYLLRLGQTAISLAHYEDASQHFSLCLKLLHDRRVHRPALRIEARYNLAITYSIRGSYTVAIQNYEDALRLCHHYDLNEAIPNIYYGLSKAYRCLGDFDRARHTAHEALHIYQEKGDGSLQCCMHYVLGRISFLSGDYNASENYYTTSLSLAINNHKPKMLMLDCAALATLFLETGQIEIAKEYVHRTLEIMPQVEHAFSCGVAYDTIGKVTLAEARLADGNARQGMFDESISWLQKSATQFKSASVYVKLAEVYHQLATVSEELQRTQDALDYWKLAYEEASQAKHTPLFDASCYAGIDIASSIPFHLSTV